LANYAKTLNKADQQETFSDVIILSEGALDYETVMTFAAPRTQGDITIKAVVSGDASLNLTGNLIIEKGGTNAQGFLKQSVLLLGENARAKATPQLEIKTDEVRASHSATVGQVDQEQLFYFMSRGLNKKQAVEAVVRSFLAEVVEKLRPDQEKALTRALQIDYKLSQ